MSGIGAPSRSTVMRGAGFDFSTDGLPRPVIPAWSLAAVLAVGAALRLRGLLSFPFEQDELYTVVESTQLFHTTLKPGIAARPLYYLLEHVLLLLGPVSPFSLRLLPFLFGVTGVGATWLLGSRLFGSVAGWISALLAAVSPWLLYVSGFARYWSLVYLLATLFFLCLALAYEHDRARYYIGALVIGVLGSLTHPTFLFAAFGAVLGVTLVTRDRRPGWRWPSRRGWLWLWGPWAATMLVLYAALRLTGQLGAYRNFGGRGLLPTIRVVPAMLQWMTPTVFVAGGLGALILLIFPASTHARRFGAMTVLGCGSTIILLIVSAMHADVYADYGIAVLPLLFVSAGAVVALGAQRLSSGRRLFAGAAAAVFVAGMLPYTVSHLSDGTRFDYRPALRAIEATAPTIPVWTWPLVVSQYYSPSLDAHYLTLGVPALDSALSASGDMWVVLSIREYGLVGDDGGRGAAWLDLHCRRVRSDRRLRFDSRVYEVALDRCRA